MKRFVSLLTACILLISMTTIAMASSEPEKKVLTIEEAAAKYGLDSSEIIDAVSSDSIKARGPAPALSYVYFWAVDTNQAMEDTYRGQMSTVYDHGGTQLYAYTYEQGYARSYSCTIDGMTMTCVEWDYVDLTGDTIADGVVRCYSYTWTGGARLYSGNLYTSATSSNYPWNTVSASMYVR